MIHAIDLKKETSESRMFMKASGCCHLEEQGYTEEEYFMRGTANVYGEGADESLEILYQDAPYTNRFIVRKPVTNPSGRVVIEILNSSSYMDIDRFWVLTWQEIIRSRDIYIGITSKPVTMKSLKKFDSERYRDLSWDNPGICLFHQPDLGNFKGASDPETEDGLFWDMLTDLALYIREGAEFLNDAKPEYIYAAGWSQSASYLVTYTNYFAKQRYQEGLPPVFDGYFAAAPGPCVVPGLNQSENADIYAGQATVKFSNVPYFTMHTESENANLGTCLTRIPNSDRDILQYRIYDIPGATHDSQATMDTYYREAGDDHARCGLHLIYPGKEENPNDFPYDQAYRAGLRCLYEWAERGVKPPVTDSIPYDEYQVNEIDENGNARNGWRLPEIEVPVCIYQPRCTPLKPADDTRLYGCEIPYEEDVLCERYHNLEYYKELVTKSAREAVEKRLLLQEDMEMCIEHAVKKAEKYGLRKG